MHLYLCMCIYECVFMHVHYGVYLYMSINVCASMCIMYVHLHVCMYVYLCMCMYVCVNIHL